MRVTTDSNYTRCAAGLVLDGVIHLADQICKNSFKNCAAGPLEPPYPFSVDYRTEFNPLYFISAYVDGDRHSTRRSKTGSNNKLLRSQNLK